YTGLTFWFETEALVRAGDVEQATQDVRHLKERLGSSRRYHLSYLRAETVLASHRGETDQALGYLCKAAQLAEEVGLPGVTWLIQAELGEMYRQGGKEEMASQALARACEILLSLADQLEDEQRTSFLSATPTRRVLERVQFSP